MPQRNGYKSHRGRSGVARKVQFGGPSGTNGIQPSVLVDIDQKQLNDYLVANQAKIDNQLINLPGHGTDIAILALNQSAKFTIYLSDFYYRDGSSNIIPYATTLPNPYYKENIADLAAYFRTTPTNIITSLNRELGTVAGNPSFTAAGKMRNWSINSVKVKTSYFGGVKKGGGAPSGTGFMIASSSSQAFQPAAPALRPNYLFRFRQNFAPNASQPGAGGPSI